MHTKLSAFFAFLAFVMLTFTWCLNYSVGVKVLNVEQVLLAGLAALMIYFYFIGRYLARIGIALVEEALSDMRAREEEHRRMMMRRLEEQEEAVAAAVAEAPGADSGGKASAKNDASAKAQSAGKGQPNAKADANAKGPAAKAEAASGKQENKEAKDKSPAAKGDAASGK